MDESMPAQEEKILLTIAIPTYNRAGYLDECLNHICSQLEGYEDRVELVVSDNCSTDSTGEVVQRYIEKGHPVIYRRNPENIGSDNNFVKCFKEALGKYVLLMGDDDILLEGSLSRILNVLERDDYGVVFLRTYGFKEDYVKERPKVFYKGFDEYSDKKVFIKRTSYFLTFISSNIVNKSILGVKNLDKYYVANLVQLSWTFSAIFAAEKNAIINEYAVAAKLFNSGGYNLCRIFGNNTNAVFKRFVDSGFDKEYFDLINRKLLRSFFPANIARLKIGKLSLGTGKFFNDLFPLYKKYINFWLFTVPIIFLPEKIVYYVYNIGEKIRRIGWLIASLFKEWLKKFKRERYDK
jgi:abequosyltransferase